VSRAESLAVGVFLVLTCGLSVFVAGWWLSASLAIYHVLPLSERNIETAALASLALGLALAVWRIKRWVPRFYSIRLEWLVPIYVFWSAIAVAFFMGLPLGNLILGTIAGLCIGRRERHAGAAQESLFRTARGAGIFTAMVTGAGAVAIGVLALREPAAATGPLPWPVSLLASKIWGPVLVGAACVLVALVQFWLTLLAARSAFRVGTATAGPTPPRGRAPKRAPDPDSAK
jgi:hypothetical protein